MSAVNQASQTNSAGTPPAPPAPPLPPGRSAGRVWGQSLAAGVVCLAILTVVQRLIGLGRSLVICDWLPVSELGKWDLYFTFLMVSGPLVAFGLPAALGRFAEGYRTSDRTLRFILITSTSCLAAFAFGAIGLCLFREPLGRLLLPGQSGSQWLTVLLPVLLAIVVFNYVTALMNALRLHRGFAIAQAAHGIGFAICCLITVPRWGYLAVGVVVAYGVTCTISSLIAVLIIYRAFRNHAGATQGDFAPSAPSSLVAESHSVLRAIVPFAAALWLATLIANCFHVSDRILVLHLSPGEDLALDFLGQYHAARIIPGLLVQFAMSLAAMITPHLVRDWDSGQTGRAVEQLGSLLKLVSVGYCLVGTLVLATAPILFSMLLGDKFDSALQLLPWTLASGITFSLTFIVQNIFWCSKKAWWTSFAFLLGLAANVVASLLIYPVLGIQGVVIGTFLATSATLWMMIWIAEQRGFRFSEGTCLLMALPVTLTAGIIGCSLIAIVGLYVLVSPTSFVTAGERAMIAGRLARFGRLARNSMPVSQ